MKKIKGTTRKLNQR